MTKGVKKAKDNGATNISELFLYTEVRVYLRGTLEAGHVNGVLLDFDGTYYYLGDLDQGINTAVHVDSVGCIVSLDAIIKQEFSQNTKPDGDLN